MRQSAAQRQWKRAAERNLNKNPNAGVKKRHLTLVRPEKELTFTITIPAYRAPAFRAAIIDASNRVGQRMENGDIYPREQALVNASLCLAELRKAICAQVAEDDPYYWPRWVQHERAAESASLGEDEED